jgi:hypothetical protein
MRWFRQLHSDLQYISGECTGDVNRFHVIVLLIAFCNLYYFAMSFSILKNYKSVFPSSRSAFHKAPAFKSINIQQNFTNFREFSTNSVSRTQFYRVQNTRHLQNAFVMPSSTICIAIILIVCKYLSETCHLL